MIDQTVTCFFDANTDPDLFEQYSALALLISSIDSDEDAKLWKMLKRGDKYRIRVEKVENVGDL